MANQLMKKIVQSEIVDKSSGLFKNAQMQGAQKLRNEAYFLIRRNDERCSATPQMGVRVPFRVFQQLRIGGFTLVEILIAIFILSLVMTTVYVSYTGILKNSRQLEEEGNIYKMARTSMERLINDLSSLQTSAGSFDLHVEEKKSGNHEFHSLSFWSASHLALGENEGEGRPAEISYYVRENDDGKSFSLWRADVPGTKPDETKKAEGGFTICRNIDTFRLTFYDVNEQENDTWDSSSAGMPIAVKIELFLTNESDLQKPYKFMTKVFLPVNK